MADETLSADQVRKEIKSLVAELTEREPDEITDTASFVQDLGVDSIMAIEMLVALDRAYHIEMPETEFNRARNIDEAVLLVMRCIAASSQSGNGA
jgi:acyl carrier protein